ncbi:MAG: glycosyltransferase family 2 protein [Desulfobacteraceae bacterium]|nr:glycosyltransferase family 2 protein [Desulfobacteraceae bacterium]
MMNEENSLVSILIPTYNRSNYVKETIESAISQSYTNIEIIISNNNSIDNTEEIVRDYITKYPGKIKYYRQKRNIGMVGNWNFCLEKCSGEYFVLLSDDDVLRKHFVELTIKAYTIDSNISFVCNLPAIKYENTGSIIYPDSNILTSMDAITFIKKHFLGLVSLAPCGMLFRTQDVISINGYPNEFPFATDTAVWLQIAFDGEIIVIGVPLVYYRIHSSALSSSIDSIREDRSLIRLCKEIYLEKEISDRRKMGLEKVFKIFHILYLNSKILNAKQMGISNNEMKIYLRKILKIVGFDFLFLMPVAIFSLFCRSVDIEILKRVLKKAKDYIMHLNLIQGKPS